MIEILQSIFFSFVIIAGAIIVSLDFLGYFDESEEDNRYHLSDIDDLDDFEDSLSDKTQEVLCQEIKKYKEE